MREGEKGGNKIPKGRELEGEKGQGKMGQGKREHIGEWG